MHNVVNSCRVEYRFAPGGVNTVFTTARAKGLDLLVRDAPELFSIFAPCRPS